ncbi:endonuclease/exonuclease/phosphatase family protein [Cupriavidus sp. IK-TO18]|uniref:endonuclease/exonuclease/phosphatase family protein n=1 Tax=Cupriavidus sp. IK-TO18 TaxID=2782182 RepID=UPI0021045EE3|nr:endonuclease/exonuclease/phosphatase family protein [Cupriavidus sp. IK-TO18]
MQPDLPPLVIPAQAHGLHSAQAANDQFSVPDASQALNCGPIRSAGLARMTVVSYNIHRAVGTDRRYRPDRIAAVLEELGADIVALQEVESGSSNDHTLEYLAGHTGMHVVSGFTRVRGNADFGNALLTRFAPQAVNQIDLTVKGCEARGAIDVTLACTASGHASALRVIATHLGLRPGERRHQVQQLLNYVAAAPPLPTILLGDVNEWFLWGRPLRWLHAYFEHTPHTATFPSRMPIFALDRIWVSPRAHLVSVASHRSPLARVASDHLPLLACFEVPLAEAPSAAAGPEIRAEA